MIPDTDFNAKQAYYLLHHAIVEAIDPEGKIRVLFNTSFHTASGVSVNDILLPDPKLQIWLVR